VHFLCLSQGHLPHRRRRGEANEPAYDYRGRLTGPGDRRGTKRAALCRRSARPAGESEGTWPRRSAASCLIVVTPHSTLRRGAARARRYGSRDVCLRHQESSGGTCPTHCGSPHHDHASARTMDALNDGPELRAGFGVHMSGVGVDGGRVSPMSAGVSKPPRVEDMRLQCPRTDSSRRACLPSLRRVLQ
jgi:hypothetical protein